MAVKYHCSECGKTFSIKEKYIGKRAKCRCGARFIVPDTNIHNKPGIPAITTNPANLIPIAEPANTPVKHSHLPWFLALIVVAGITVMVGIAAGMYISGFENKNLKKRISQLQEAHQRLLAKFNSLETTMRQESGKKTSALPPTESPSKFVSDNPRTSSRNTRQTEPRFPIPEKTNTESQQRSYRNNYTNRSTQAKPIQTEFESTKLIRFLSGERSHDILISESLGPFGIPNYKTQRAPSDSYYYIVESRINTLDWPKEHIEFDKRQGVDINSKDIILETTDGKLFHPSFASFGMSDTNSKRIGFAKGPLRNIALIFGQGTVGDKPAGIMSVYIARPGPEPKTIATANGGVIDPNLEEFRIVFAFILPHDAQVKKVCFVNN